MDLKGWMQRRPSLKKTASVEPAGVLYHERFHMKFFFVSGWLPLLLIALSFLVVRALNMDPVKVPSVAITAEPAPEVTDPTFGKATEMFAAIVQFLADFVGELFNKLAEAVPVIDLSWLPWLGRAWWVFLAWYFLRSWYRWRKSYAEVSVTGFTIYTPESFWFALGAKGNRTVPAWMVYNSDRSSNIFDVVLFWKTVSEVNVFVKDTAGNDDQVRVSYARRAKQLIEAIEQLGAQNAPAT